MPHLATLPHQLQTTRTIISNCNNLASTLRETKLLKKNKDLFFPNSRFLPYMNCGCSMHSFTRDYILVREAAKQIAKWMKMSLEEGCPWRELVTNLRVWSWPASRDRFRVKICHVSKWRWSNAQLRTLCYNWELSKYQEVDNNHLATDYKQNF